MSLEQHGWDIHVVWTPAGGSHGSHGSRKGIPQTTGHRRGGAPGPVA
jgi:hypothetical protein